MDRKRCLSHSPKTYPHAILQLFVWFKGKISSAPLVVEQRTEADHISWGSYCVKVVRKQSSSMNFSSSQRRTRTSSRAFPTYSRLLMVLKRINMWHTSGFAAPERTTGISFQLRSSHPVIHVSLSELLFFDSLPDALRLSSDGPNPANHSHRAPHP